ncbi:MAG: hypothetical protein WCR42_02795 [bacterium]
MKKFILAVAIIAISSISYLGAMYDTNLGGTWVCQENPTLQTMPGEVVRYTNIGGGYRVQCEGLTGTCWRISGETLFINSDLPPYNGIIYGVTLLPV